MAAAARPATGVCPTRPLPLPSHPFPPTPLQHGLPPVQIPAGTTISIADVVQLAGAAAVTALGGHKRWEVRPGAAPATRLGASPCWCLDPMPGAAA